MLDRSSAPPAVTVSVTARLFQLLADPTRLALVWALTRRELTVAELVAELGVPRSRVSNHLACLRWCEVVEARPRGRHRVYRLRDPRVPALLADAERLAAGQARRLGSCTRLGPDWM